MDIQQFWQLIEKTHKASNGDPGQQEEQLIRALPEKSIEDIMDYQRIHDTLMDRAYISNLWNAAYLINGGCGDDGFMDFRAWLIAQGRDIYENAIENPDTLADIVSLEQRYEIQCEDLLYVGIHVYKQKTKNRDGIPRFRSPASLEESIPLTEDQEELKVLYPKLWEKFGG